MKKYFLFLIISFVFSSCSSILYTNRNANNTFNINSNVKSFEVNFPKLNNKTYVTTNGVFSHTLPRLNRKYRTIEIKSNNYETQQIKLKKSVRAIPLILDILSFPITLGLPVLIDVFKSDFYKISNSTKNNSITLVNTQSYMLNQFNQIKDTRNSEVLNMFISEYPFFNKKESAIVLRDSLEFLDALNSHNESNISKFIQTRKTSKFIPKATKIEAEFIKNRIAFSRLETTNSVTEIENFILEFPNAIQIPKAYKLLVEVAEKEALNSNNSSKKIIFLNNYLIPNKKFISNSDYLVKKSNIFSKILSSIEMEIENKDYNTIKNFYVNYNSLDKARIEQDDKNMFIDIFQKELSKILFNDLLKVKSNQDQLSFENKINTDFPNLFINSNIVLKVLENNINKNGLITIYNSDYLSIEFNKINSSIIYKNKPSISFDYKNVEFNFQKNPIKQVLNFNQNLLVGNQENYLSNELNVKISIKELAVINEEFFLKNKLIGINYFDASGSFIYKYEFENGVNLTLKKLDENISQYDYMVSTKNLNEALDGYQKLGEDKFPKELKQNLILVSKIAECKNLIEKRDLELERLRIAEEKRQEIIHLAEEKKQEKLRVVEEKRQEIIRLAEEKKQEKLRVAEEKRQATLQKNTTTLQYNNYNSNSYQNTESYSSHICNYCHRQFTGKGYYMSYSRDGLQINRSDNENYELCCSSICAKRIMGF